MAVSLKGKQLLTYGGKGWRVYSACPKHIKISLRRWSNLDMGNIRVAVGS
jgi:hypothetical protein